MRIWSQFFGYAANSFKIIQTPSGTSPVADSPDDTLTLTSSNSSITITGNSTTDTVDFVVNNAALGYTLQNAYDAAPSADPQILGVGSQSFRLAIDENVNSAQGDFIIEVGLNRDGDGGDVLISAGSTSNSGSTAGSLQLLAGDADIDGTISGLVYIASGVANENSSSNSGYIKLQSGAASALSGDIYLLTGTAGETSGSVEMTTGDGTLGPSGGFAFLTGTGPTSGGFSFITGPTTDDQSGGFLFQTGAPTGDAGSFQFVGGLGSHDAVSSVFAVQHCQYIYYVSDAGRSIFIGDAANLSSGGIAIQGTSTPLTFNLNGTRSTTLVNDNTDFFISSNQAALRVKIDQPLRIQATNFVDWSQFGPDPTSVGVLPAVADTLVVTNIWNSGDDGRALVIEAECNSSNKAGGVVRGVHVFARALGSVGLSTATTVGGLNCSRLQMVLRNQSAVTNALFTGQSVSLNVLVSGSASTITEVDHYQTETNIFSSTATVTHLHGFRGRAFTATGGTVTNAVGFLADEQTAGGTTNLSFAAAGAGKMGFRYTLGTNPTEYIQSSAASTLDMSANTTVNLRIAGTTILALTASSLAYTDGVNESYGTSTGSKKGTSSSQKLGFWNATPVIQPANTAAIDTLLVTTGLRASGGVALFDTDIKAGVVGKGLYVKEGSNATMGVATLSGGTVTVSTTKVTASSRIFLSVQSLGTVAVATPVAVTARTAATSFTISSSAITDTSVVAWLIMEPA